MADSSVIDSFLETMFGSLPVSPPALKARAEMRDVLEDRRRALLDMGFSESEASGRAIAEIVRDELDVLDEDTADLPAEHVPAAVGTTSPAPSIAPFLARLADALYWYVVALVFVLWSVSSGDWHITWTILPVAAVLYWVFRRAIKRMSEQRDRTADG